jgi:hypothetical protein
MQEITMTPRSLIAEETQEGCDWGALLLRDESPSWWPGTGGGEVWHQAKVALANGIVAVPTIWLLDKTRPLWGFSTAKRVVPGAAREAV